MSPQGIDGQRTHSTSIRWCLKSSPINDIYTISIFKINF